jgi:CRISPR/Cas system-associated protein endoribonuclease Cas2
MMQYSVYIRHCASGADVHENAYTALVPILEQSERLRITDKQFGSIFLNFGQTRVPKTPPTTTVELF